MHLDIDEAALTRFLEENEDCSCLAEGEYVADLYDAPRPLTLDIAKGAKGYELVAAAYLEYDEELDGWYMGERADDVKEILEALKSACEGHA